MGPRCSARGSEIAAWTPRLLAGDAAERAADALYRMALWRHHQPRRDADQFGRQSADGRDGEYAARPLDGRCPHPDLWLGRSRRQFLQQHGARRQRAGRLQLQSEQHPARPGRDLHRAAARYGAEGSHRLGFPYRADLGRELSLHHGVRAVEQPAPEPEQEQRLRYADGLWRGVHSLGDGRTQRPVRTLHLDPRYRGPARAEQLHVLALDDLHLRQLYQYRHRPDPGGDQELDLPVRLHGRNRIAALARRCNDSESDAERALSRTNHGEGPRRGPDPVSYTHLTLPTIYSV